MQRVFTLDGRLSAIEKMIPSCRCVADIGADHGRLGAHLLLCDRCRRVQLLDISEPSLRKAAELIERLDLRDRAVFGVGDGADALKEKPDCAVIAGMGGVTIAGIVERGKEAFRDSLLVMQPNVGIDCLRRALIRSGFMLTDEDVVRAGNRWYVVMAARKGETQYTEKEILVGPALLRERHPNLGGYAKFRARVTRKALLGAKQGGVESQEDLAKQLSIWEEILNEYDGG